ncbi:MAG: ABC transporter permease [Gammaproteobacteria bacterium]|nr:ABC transporter permease [Gammaproteobacteria bacterium]
MPSEETIAAERNASPAPPATPLGERALALARVLARPAHRTGVTWALCAPMLALIVLCFVLPCLAVLHTGVSSPVIGEEWPAFVEALREDPEVVPGEPVFEALARALREPQGSGRYLRTMKSFGQQDAEIWRMFQEMADTPVPEGFTSAKTWFVGVDAEWSEPETWLVIRRLAAPYTLHFLVSAFDLNLEPNGTFELVPPERRFYGRAIAQTLTLALWVTLVTLLLGCPLAYRLTTMSARRARLALQLLLLLLWTSVLVKTYAAMVIFDRQGIVNSLLIGVGWIDEPLAMMPSRAVVIATMSYALLPFMVVPLYYRMRSVPIQYLRAAVSLGAPPLRAVVTAYGRTMLPGVAVGCLLVFLLAIGNYPVPALTASAQGMTISMLIADFVTKIANDGMAAAMGTIVLVICVALCALYVRAFGPQRSGAL